MKKIKAIMVSLMMLIGILVLALGSQEIAAQQNPDVPEIEECETCQHNRRQANVPCIRGFWNGGNNGLIWV